MVSSVISDSDEPSMDPIPNNRKCLLFLILILLGQQSGLELISLM